VKEMTNKPKILIFEAHSDDCVIGMGGTVIILSKTHDVILVTMTKGETAYTKVEDKDKMTDIRKGESLSADKILGVKEHIFLTNPCQDLQNNLTNYHDVIKLIRKYCPIRIYTHKSSEKHRDHRNAHDVVVEGWWKASENVLADYGKPIRVPDLYCFEVTDLFEFPDEIIDISDVFAIKMKSLASFNSQFSVLPGLDNCVQGLAMVRGYMGGFKYGEAFVKSDFMAKPLGNPFIH
jgi:LmbE family N-acetylglucosaminyl deacetylase